MENSPTCYSMSILEKAKKKFICACSKRSVDIERAINVLPLSSHDAIGNAEGDFAIKKGKEYVIEATFDNARGQAFTGKPREWDGTLEDILSLDLSDVGNRGVFVAAMNAVLRRLGLVTGTIHCRDEDPTDCGPRIAGQLEARFGSKRFGVVGLQPAILEGLTKHFSPEAVRVVDLNPNNIGGSKSGVEVWDGQTDL